MINPESTKPNYPIYLIVYIMITGKKSDKRSILGSILLVRLGVNIVL
jgi:hypothetical protein